MKINTFRLKVEQVDDNFGVSSDGSVIEQQRKAKIIITVETGNGSNIGYASENYDANSKESRRAAVAEVMAAISMLVMNKCFPEDTPRYKLSYEPGNGFKHEFEGMPEDLCHA